MVVLIDAIGIALAWKIGLFFGLICFVIGLIVAIVNKIRTGKGSGLILSIILIIGCLFFVWQNYKLIQDVKKDSAKSCAMSYVTRVEQAIAIDSLKENYIKPTTITDVNFVYTTGCKPDSVNLKLNEKGEVESGTMSMNGFDITLENGKIKETKKIKGYEEYQEKKAKEEEAKGKAKTIALGWVAEVEEKINKKIIEEKNYQVPTTITDVNFVDIKEKPTAVNVSLSSFSGTVQNGTVTSNGYVVTFEKGLVKYDIEKEK